MLGNAVFINYLLTSLLPYGQLKVLFLCRSLLRADAERGDTAQSSRSQPGAVPETSSKWRKAKVFSKNLQGLSVCTCYGKKSAKRVWKLLNIMLKSRSSVVTLMAEGGWGGSPQINERMGNTGGCLWECRQFSSIQNEPYETCRARGDFPVNRLLMVSFSRGAKKKCTGIIIIIIKTKMCHQMYLGGCPR